MTKRCGVCATEHPVYDGVTSEGSCVAVESFHKDRGSQTFYICHGCSTLIVASWARVHGAVRAETVAQSQAPTEDA